MRIERNYQILLADDVRPHAHVNRTVVSDHPSKEHIHAFRRGRREQAWNPVAMPEHLTYRVVIPTILVHDHFLTYASKSLIDQSHGLTQLIKVVIGEYSVYLFLLPSPMI